MIATREEIKRDVLILLKSHYSFEDYEFDDFFLKKKIKELSIDSLGVVELFLVIEEGFRIGERLSDKIEIKGIEDKTIGCFLDDVSGSLFEILENYKP